MKNLFIWTLIIMSSLICNNIMAQEKESVKRSDLMTIILSNQQVSKVEIKEITIPPGTSSPLHLHPCPVVGYIVSGIVLFQEEGKETVILKAGDTFYEPKNKPILHFDNASETDSLVFVAIYLIKENEDVL